MGYLRRKRIQCSCDVDVKAFTIFTHNNLERITPSVDGVGFMKSVVNFFEQKRIENKVGDDARFSYTVNGEEQRMYIKFKWEGDELVTDNESTWKAMSGRDLKYPCMFIKLSLALNKGWLELPRNGVYKLVPNLKQELFDPTVVQDIQNSGDVFESDSTHVNASKQVFWTASDFWYGVSGQEFLDRVYVRLSYNCNWRFLNLNSAFESAVGSGRRTLMCYSNVATSSVVGGQTTDLLREFDYGANGSGSIYFEPNRVQYIGLRSNTLDILEVQIAEKTGALSELTEGTTSIALNFQPI